MPRDRFRHLRPIRVRIAAVLFTAALVMSTGACGGGTPYDGAISCVYSQNVEGLGTLDACEEAAVSARQQLQQGCPAATATGARTAPILDAPCPRTNTLGGCQITSGGFAETFWYYDLADDAAATATPADIQTLCSSGGGTFFEPPTAM